MHACRTPDPSADVSGLLDAPAPTGGTRGLDTVALLRAQVREVHSQLEEAFTRWLYALAPASPPRGSHVVALYVHAATAEDVTIHSLLMGVAPVYEAEWAGKGPARYSTADLAPLRAYARQIFAATDAYLAGLAPDEASRTVDLTKLGHGHPTVAWLVSTFVVLQLSRICGELVAAVLPSSTSGPTDSLPVSPAVDMVRPQVKTDE